MLTIWGRANSVNVQRRWVLRGAWPAVRADRRRHAVRPQRRARPPRDESDGPGPTLSTATSCCGNRIHLPLSRAAIRAAARLIPPIRNCARASIAGSTGRCPDAPARRAPGVLEPYVRTPPAERDIVRLDAETAAVARAVAPARRRSLQGRDHPRRRKASRSPTSCSAPTRSRWYGHRGTAPTVRRSPNLERWYTRLADARRASGSTSTAPLT